MNLKKIIRYFRKHTRKKSFLRKCIVWVCDTIGGHEASNDVGYAGGGMLDVWCKHCDGMYQISRLEKNVSEEFSELINLLRDNKKSSPLPDEED